MDCNDYFTLRSVVLQGDFRMPNKKAALGGRISGKKKWPLAVASFFTDAYRAAKGHFCSLLLSNIIGYLAFLQIGKQFDPNPFQ